MFTNTSQGRSLLAAFASVFLIFSLSGCGLFGGNEAPSSPSNLNLSASQSGVQVSWDGSSNANGYNIYRSKDSISTDLSNASSVNDSPVKDSTSFLDDGVENTTVYYYRVTAVNGEGESGPSSGAKVRMPFPDSPDRPSN